MRKYSKLMLAIFICGFIYSGYQLYIFNQEKKESNKSAQEITEIAKGKPIRPSVNKDTEESKIKDKDLKRFNYEVDFDNLKEINSDTFGWIRNQGYINYPVVKTDDRQEYLKKDFKGNRNSAGAIFALGNTKESDDNITLYGHVMGVYRTDMFSTLHDYREMDYRNNFNHFQFVTPNHIRDFEVFAIFEMDIVKDEFNPFISNFSSTAESKYFYDNVVKKSEMSVNHEYKDTNRYVTMMTCLRGARDIDDRLFVILIEK